MNSPAEKVSAVSGVVIAAIAIWGTVRSVNQRRKLREAVPAAIVAACLWGPFSWLILAPGMWSDYRLSWVKMWPLLPGFLPGALLFDPAHDLLELSTMAVVSLVLWIGLTWLGYRNRVGLIAAAIVALLISVPTALIARAVYLA